MTRRKVVIESESVIEPHQAGGQKGKRATSCSALGLRKVAADEELALFRFFRPPAALLSRILQVCC